MFKRFAVFFLMGAVLFAVSCTTSTSVGGASIETGYEINNNFEVKSTKTTFNAGEEFYFSFHNNADFRSNKVTLRLLDSATNEILLEHDYDVETNWNILADQIWFNNAGKYKIVCLIDGKVRATQEVIIQ